MKRLLSLTTLLLLAVASFCQNTFVGYDFEVDGFYYKITSSSSTPLTVSVSYKEYWTGNKGSGYTSGNYTGSITVPSTVTYNGTTYNVTSIGNYAFYFCSGLTSVTIPSSVTSIGNGAFKKCTDLTSITIPNSVTSIGTDAFSGCYHLTSITIPSSVTSIGTNAFEGCYNLTKVIVSDIVKWCSISFSYSSSNPLYYAKHLYSDENSEITELAIPDGVTKISGHAFSSCTGLTSITIPSSVTSIGSTAFSGCSGLTSINVDKGNAVYDSRDNCNAIIETSTNTLVTGCKTTIIPSSVTSIGWSAFENCSGLTSMTIPSSVTSIDGDAFYGCSGLTKVIVSDIAKWCSISFNSYSSNPLYYAKHLYSDENSEISELAIPDGVTSIGSGAFSGCTGLKSVTIPSSVTSIGSYAFYGCSGLTSITIPSGVTSIGYDAFYGCSGLTSITIPSGVTSIGYDAFYGCSGLTSINVDKNSLSLFKLWNQSRTSSTYLRDYLYDTGTGEKIDFFKTNASSVSVFIPEPKNYTITSKSLTIGGKNTELPYKVNGLAPNTSQGTMSLTIGYKDAEGNDQTFTTSQTIKTQELTLTTEQPKVVSMGNVVVSATTNVDEEEKNVGFEWRRTDWTSDFASNSGSAVVYGNTMEGYIRNMNIDKLWKYRAYYLSDAGVYYYGDWVGLDASNTSYFEPTVHTYADISTTGNVALIRGYVLNGTDKIEVQGFKYWKTANKGNSLDIDMEGDMQTTAIPADAITKTVDIVGSGQQLMNATLEGLDYDATYHCVAFATTTENETFYGEEQMFTTESITGIEGVKESAAGSSKAVTVVAYYDLNGKRLAQPQKGLNIIRMSDGTTRKVVSK